MALRIAQINDLWYSIPPVKYGGAERIVNSLTEGLVKRGHEVTLYAVGTSKTSAKLVSIYPRPMFEDGIARNNLIWPLLNITEAIDRERDYDIIHFHLNIQSDYPALPLSVAIKNKVVFTMHFAAPSLKGYPDRDRFLRKYKDLNFVSLSQAQRKGMEYLNWIATVYNGIDLSQYTFSPTAKDYFMWMGKFNPDKGAKEAILAAKKAGVKLLVAGAIDNLDPIDKKYYEEDIKPLMDGTQIQYIGELGATEKNTYLGGAIGFLNPIHWNEPFGLVSVEAMATGTPVISFTDGALPEVIDEGKTGYLVKTVDEIVAKMKTISTLNRADVRRHVEEHFSDTIMVQNYEQVYMKLLNQI